MKPAGHKCSDQHAVCPVCGSEWECFVELSGGTRRYTNRRQGVPMVYFWNRQAEQQAVTLHALPDGEVIDVTNYNGGTRAMPEHA